MRTMLTSVYNAFLKPFGVRQREHAPSTPDSRVPVGLLDQMALFGSFMDKVPAYVYIKDSNHVFQFASEQVLTAGKDSWIPTERIIGSTPADLFPAAVAATMMAEDDEIIRTGQPISRELAIPMKDGSTVYLEGTKFPIVLGAETLIGGFYIDVTERKRSEEERERLRTAIEQSGEMVLIVGENGEILYTNPAFSKVTGFSREEVVGKTNEIWQSGLHDASFYLAAKAVLNRGESWHGRMTNKRKDGSLINEEVTISPVKNEKGEVIHYVEIKRDITREVELEEMLAHAQRMEAIGTLAGGVAHDHNNVLQTILGNAEIILEEFADSSEGLGDLVREIREAAEQSATQTSQLLAFARKQVIKPRSVNLNEEFAGMKNMLGRLIGANVNLILDPGEGLWNVLVDPAQMNQLFTNICINATDAIADVGQIIIRTWNVAEHESLKLPFANTYARDYVCVEIKDTGCGMSPDQQARAFEPFFTTKPMYEGTGLGLSTVYGIVKQNDGFIYVNSTEGEGTIITIYLPRDTSQVSLQVVPQQSGTGTGMKKTILLVEDELAILKLLKRALDRLDYNVIAASSPAEALSQAATIDHIDLVITDVIMPSKSGKDVAMEVRQYHPDIKVLFISGYTADVMKDVPDFDKETSFVQKPFNIAELSLKVENLLESPMPARADSKVGTG